MARKSKKAGRRSKKGKRRRKKRGMRRRRGKKERIPKAVREMLDVTQPLTDVYSWCGKYEGAQGTSQIVPLLVWNDSFDIAPKHNRLLAQLNQGSISNSPLNKFAVGRYEAQFTMKNTSNIELTMDFYTIQWRDDTVQALTPQIPWNTNGSNNVFYPTPFSLLFASILESTSLGAPTLSTWPVGITPFDCNKFCSYFKIIKVKKDVKLIGAGFKTFKVKDRKWRIWDGTKIAGATNAITASYTGFERRTKCVFAIVTGGAVNDASNNVNFGPSNVDVSGQERYMYTAVANASKRMFITQDTNTVGTYTLINLQTEAASGYVNV